MHFGAIENEHNPSIYLTPLLRLEGFLLLSIDDRDCGVSILCIGGADLGGSPLGDVGQSKFELPIECLCKGEGRSFRLSIERNEAPPSGDISP